MKPIPLILATSLLVTSVPSEAEELWVNIGGVSHHSSGEYNEQNWGIGIETSLSSTRKETRVGMGYYKNSINEDSFYVAGNTNFYSFTTWQNEYKFGLLYGLVSGYEEYFIVPMLSPTLTIESGKFGITFGYVPNMNITGTAVVAAQFKYRIN